MAAEPDPAAPSRNPSKRERDLRASLENLPLPAYICDSEGIITYFNRPAVVLWGREPKLNDSVHRFSGSFKLFSSDGTPLHHDQSWMALTLHTGKECLGREIVVERPNGQRITVFAHTNPFHDELGQVLGAANILVEITDRKQAEKEAKHPCSLPSTARQSERDQAEDRYRELIDSIEAIVWRCDAETLRVTFVSKQAERILGYLRDQWLAESSFWTDHIHPADRERVSDYFLKSLRSKRDHRLEYRMVAADGRAVWFHHLMNAIPENDEPKEFVGIMVDITARKEEEERLLSSERRMAEAQHIAHIGSWEHDLKTNQVTWSEETYRLFGMEPSEDKMSFEAFAAHLDPGDFQRIREPLARAILERTPFSFDYGITTSDGTRKVFRDRGEVVADEAGQAIRLVGTVQDITDRKRGEDFRAHLAAIVESSVNAIVATSLEGTITSWNAGAERLFGFAAAEVVGRSIKVIVPVDRHVEEEDMLRRIKMGERIEHVDTIRVHKNGGLVRVSVSVSPVLDMAAVVVGASNIASDISQRKETEATLRLSEQRLIEAQAVAQIGSWELDLRTNELTWSDEHFRLFGLDPRDRGISYEELLAHILPEDARQVHHMMEQALRDRRPFVCDYRVKLPDGTTRFLHARGKIIPGDGGQPVKMVGTAQDVTERKQIEADREENHQQVLTNRSQLQTLSRGLIRAQEAERRRLAGELHDEIGQVLTAVSLSLELTKGIVDEGARGRLDESMAIVDRAIDQVRGMSLNLRPAMLDVMGLESALRWFVDRQARGSGVKIELVSSLAGKRLAPELETACFRIVQETLTNVARHAEARSVRVELGFAGTEVLLSIQDDGTGFDVATARLRATTGGSFGLLGMEERARLLGGSCEIDSGIGSGTRVRVRLPLSVLKDT